MLCPKCRADNPSDKKFCGDCGAELKAAAEAVPVPDAEPGTYYCHRHKKVPTRVRCGHCEAPVCPKCAVYGPVGVRCRQCASHRVGIRPRAVLHEVGRAAGPMAQGAGRVVWYAAIWTFVVSIFTNLFGGRDS